MTGVATEAAPSLSPLFLSRCPDARHHGGHRVLATSPVISFVAFTESLMSHFRAWPILPFSLLLGACTWVHMAPGASKVRVLTQPPSGCEKRGEINVSINDGLGPYHRNPLRVRDELETLARNEAPGIGADTVHPLIPPTDGAQRFAAWRCAR